jgi:gliding motility-associated-like protein
MRKFILLSLFSLPIFCLAQTKKANPSVPSKAIVQNKKEVGEKKPKPIIVAGTKEYSDLKKQGKLYQYEIKSENNKTVVIPYNSNLAAKTTSLTYCDYIPYVGTNAFNTEIDDSPLATVPLQFSFCFYGVTYNSLSISANGNVQFSTNSTAFSATGFPSGTVNMIAPFWADGETMVASGGITYGKIKVVSNPTHMIISWDSLGYFNNNLDKLNSFQLILTNGSDVILPPGKNVGFKYRQMQWTTGDASGGTGGFPTTQPGTPATVGMNAGNNVDYFLIGRFGIPGTSYDGPLGNSDGVSWLDGKSFYFDACPPLGANVAPVSLYEIQECDTMRVCGNDTLIIFNTFIAPEVTQTVNVVVTSPTLGSALTSFITTNNNSAVANIMIDGSIAPAGYHIITMTATDNGSPVGTSSQQFVVYVNQGALSNLMGSVAVTPTAGACPGGVVTASVTITGGTPDSYLWSNGFTTSSTTYTTVVPADSLIYVTLTSGQCQKTIIGDININPVPVANISGNLNFCNGDASSTILTATNTLNPGSQGPHTYLWSAASGTLSSTNTASTSATGGVYTVTVTNQFGCISVTTTTVVMNESPSFTLTSANAISGGSVYCVNQDTARISIDFGGGSPTSCGLANAPCVVSNTIQVGTATTQGSTGAYTPYEGFYESAKHQYLIRASELLAAGVVPGKLNSLAFKVTNLNGYATAFDNFSIKLKCVTYNTAPSPMDNSGLVQVYGPNNINAFVGVNTYNFTQAYEWDGTSNLLVDVCFFNQNWDGNLNVEYTNVGYIASVYKDADGADQCPLSTTDGTSQNRPNIIFSNCASQQSGSQFNVVVTPTAGVVVPVSNDSIKFDLPATSGITCYTVTLINPLGNCSKDTIICVEAVQGTTQATLAASNYSVCPSQTVTLTAQGALATYTIQYTDDIGLQTSTVSPVTFNAPATTGAYVYTLTATGQCGGPLTVFTNTVNVIQGVTIANLSFSQDSVCPGTAVIASANGAILPTYTITYGTSTGTASVVGNSVTVTPTLTSPGYQTYTLTAEGACGGPITNFMDSVKVYIGTTSATITASSDTLCPGSPLTLNYTGVLATYTVTYTDASGVHTSTSVPVTYTPMAISNPTFGYITYTLTGQGPCSGPLTAFTDSVFIKQGVTQGTLVVSPDTLCPGSPVTLTAQGTLATYTIAYVDANGNPQVSVNSPVTFVPALTTTTVFGTYTYSLIAAGPCSGPLTTFPGTLNVAQGVTNASLVATPSVVCIGSPVSLSVTPLSPVSGYTITYNNGVTLNSVNNPVSFNSAVSGLNVFTLTAQGLCSAPTKSYTANVMVNNLMTLTIAPMPNQLKCLNGSVTLSANVVSSPAEPYTYNWSPAVGTNTNSTYTTSTPVTTTFVVTVNGTCANTATASVVVSNFASNISVVIPDSASICATTDLELHSSVSGGKSPYSYSWSILPSMSSISNSANLNTTGPGSEGTYSVMVTATDSCGFMDSDIQLINVLPPCEIVIPNIITPNGDGSNDLFKIKNIEYHSNSSLTIFDRWGKKVFSSANYANEWKGEGLNDGTYFYVLDVPEDKKYNGFVQILR